MKMKLTKCHACAYSGMEPDGPPELICGHDDAGGFGIFTRLAAGPGGHCGPDRPKFEQHPLRNSDGSLRNDEPARPDPYEGMTYDGNSKYFHIRRLDNQYRVVIHQRVNLGGWYGYVSIEKLHYDEEGYGHWRHCHGAGRGFSMESDAIQQAKKFYAEWQPRTAQQAQAH